MDDKLDSLKGIGTSEHAPAQAKKRGLAITATYQRLESRQSLNEFKLQAATRCSPTSGRSHQDFDGRRGREGVNSNRLNHLEISAVEIIDQIRVIGRLCPKPWRNLRL